MGDMNGGEWTVFLLLAGFGMIGGLRLAIWTLRGGPVRLASSALALVSARPWAAGPPIQTPPRVQRVERPANYPYTPQIRARRDALIAAGLRLGYSPAQLAEVWRYQPRSVGRRAAVLAGKEAT